MDSIAVSAAAKINLYLDVTARREDGYHDIESVMQSVSLCDELELALTDGGIRLDCGGARLDCGEGNLAYRAARLYLEHIGSERGVDITLQKRIPMQAGLGGGSSDAAAVLRGMNLLLGRPLGSDELCRLGARLGADVPFCVRGGCALAQGVGERLSPLPGLPGCSIVICCPQERISTPWAYAELDRLHGGFAVRRADERRIRDMQQAFGESQIKNICENMYNIFEDVTEDRLDIQLIKRCMLERGALRAMLSGSGPSVLGVFEDKSAAHTCAVALGEHFEAVYVCEPTEANII